MKITAVDVFRISLPMLIEGGYPMSGGRSIGDLDNTVVRLSTDEGLAGWGESCPFGMTYLPAFAGGARAALEELAPAVLGRDPRDTALVYDAMDRRLYGHGYAKAAIDMACWDLLGRSTGLPLVNLLGGRRSPRVAMHAGIAAKTPDLLMAAMEHRRGLGVANFSVKMSGEAERDIATLRMVGEALRPGESVVADANGGWSVHAAVQIMRATSDLPYTFEEPCGSYEECLAVRRLTGAPIMLDECLQGPQDLAVAWRDRACESIKVKVAKFGGMTPARLARDLAAKLGFTIMVDGVAGSELTNAEIAHMALSTAPAALLTAASCLRWAKGDITDVAVDLAGGTMAAPTGPGLGVTPRPDLLGEPVARYTMHG